MLKNRSSYCLVISIFFLCNHAIADHANNAENIYRATDMVITSGHKLFPNTTAATPNFNVTREEIDKTNLISAEDAIKMVPST